MSRVFLDANVPMYAHGRDHPLKTSSKTILEFVALNPLPFLTSAEVLQELIHVYRATRAWLAHGSLVFSDFAEVMEGRIEPLLAEDVLRGAALVETHPKLSARDLVHIAVMERVGATAIITADTSFDNLDGIERLDPSKANRWLRRFVDTST